MPVIGQGVNTTLHPSGTPGLSVVHTGVNTYAPPAVAVPSAARNPPSGTTGVSAQQAMTRGQNFTAQGPSPTTGNTSCSVCTSLDDYTGGHGTEAVIVLAFVVVIGALWLWA